MYFRTYLKKNNTLIANSVINTGRNEITELVYGNIASITTSGNTIYSRFIFQIDIEDIINHINKFSLDYQNLTHKLRLYNTIKLQPEIINEKLYDFNDRAFGVNLNLYKINKDFTEGIGHDFLYRNTLNFVEIGDSNSTKPSNWFNNDLVGEWDYEGAISHSGSTLIGSQLMEFGDEDFELDLTNEINQQISGSTINNISGVTSYILTFSEEIELLDDIKLNKIHFFSRFTNTYFEPHVETYKNSNINCNASNIIIGVNNNICFESDCQPTGITVFDECDDYFIQDITGITSEGNGLYNFDLFIPQNTPDIVNYLFEVSCLSGETFDFERTTVKKERSKLSKQNIYNININGVFEGEKIKRGNVRKLNFNLNSIEPNSKPEKLQYRIYITQGQTNIDIIDFTDVDYFDGQYFVYLDTSWMIPKEYYLEVKPINGFEDLPNPTIKRFFILNEKENIFY